MHPVVGSVSAYAVGWMSAALLGGGSVVWLLRRNGLHAGQIAIVLLALVASLFAGSKALLLVEVGCSGANPADFLWSPHMRIPGGFLLALASGPVVARAVGVRALWLCDRIAPASGLCIVGVRLGCLLEGCCFGKPTSLPFAISYPAGSAPYWWQMRHGLIAPGTAASLPIHPLPIYFALAGLGITVVLLLHQNRKRFEGEVLLHFLFLYLGSTWFLELMRAVPHELTREIVLASAFAACATAVGLEWQRHIRSTSSRGLRVASTDSSQRGVRPLSAPPPDRGAQ